MGTLFDIRSGKDIGSEHTFLLEVGTHFCLAGFFSKSSKTIDRLRYVQFEETDDPDVLSLFAGELENTPVQAAVVCSAFPESLLVPNKFFTDDELLLNAVYADSGAPRLHDRIAEWQLTNSYTVPRRLHDAVQSLFPSVQFFHAHTPALKIYNGYIADNQLSVHFTEASFRVLLKKESAVYLAQTYAYKTPHDVLYYLLKICSAFDLSQQSVCVILSGLIEKASRLFAEIEQYFSNVHFAHPPEISVPGNEHPHHFFTSLYNLASCAS